MTTPIQERKQGGCLTIFLILMLIGNPLTGLLYLLAGSAITQSLPNVPESAILLLGFLSFTNFVFALAIWNWKKWGVYGYVGSSLLVFVVNVLTLGFVAGLLGLVGVAILAFLVRPVWTAMEGNRFDSWVLSSPTRTVLFIIFFLWLLTIAGTGAYVVLSNSPNPAAAKQALDQGNAEWQKGNFDQAIADFSKAINLDPKNVSAYDDRGDAYYRKGNLDLAIADYTKTIDLDPEYPKVYDDRGIAYYYKGSLDQAIADFNKAIDLDPKDLDAYNSRAVVYRDQGKLDEAIAEFNNVIDLNPKYYYAYYGRGIAYQRKDQNASRR